ncbi:MAG: hypothetical protein WD250_02755 [Egibacteraceae bacterium]
MVLMLVAAAWMGGCGQDDAGEAGAAGDETDSGAIDESLDLPEWIAGVHPDPGAEASPTPQVQVIHGEVGVGEGVRLIVNGTDVTAHTVEARPGVLTYDPNRPSALIELSPGQHTATAERVRLDEFGEQHEVLDRFEWEFVVQ